MHVSRAGADDDHFFIPLPLVIPLVTWTAAVLWTTTRVSILLLSSCGFLGVCDCAL